MMIEKFLIDCFASAKSFLYSVPKLNPCLSQLPAQIYFFAVEERWKVNETAVQILHQASASLDSLHRHLQTPGDRFQEVFAIQHLAVVHENAALQHHPALEVLGLSLGLLIFGLGRDGFSNG